MNLHPNLTAFIEQFEREAISKGLYRQKLGKSEITFLEQVWGPAFQYKYDGLKAEYPFKDFKGGQRFIDFVYVKNGMRLLVEVDGFTTHARDISPAEFDDHLSRQNDLILAGWLVLRFSANQVEKRSQICQRQLKQAIGHWWSLTHGQLTTDDSDIWNLRKNVITRMATARNGEIRPIEVAMHFHISNRTAANWLQKLRREGVLVTNSEKQRSRIYFLDSEKVDKS